MCYRIRTISETKGGADARYRKRMRIMGLIFTLVAAYQAVFVSRYMTQMAWFDSIANSSLLIRILAIAAELSFSGLIMKSKLLFAIEETLWTLGFLSVLPLALMQLRRVYGIRDKEISKRLRMLRMSTVVVAAWCVFYCSYGIFYHLPYAFGLHYS